MLVIILLRYRCNVAVVVNVPATAGTMRCVVGSRKPANEGPAAIVAVCAILMLIGLSAFPAWRYVGNLLPWSAPGS